MIRTHLMVGFNFSAFKLLSTVKNLLKTYFSRLLNFGNIGGQGIERRIISSPILQVLNTYTYEQHNRSSDRKEL